MGLGAVAGQANFIELGRLGTGSTFVLVLMGDGGCGWLWFILTMKFKNVWAGFERARGVLLIDFSSN